MNGSALHQRRGAHSGSKEGRMMADSTSLPGETTMNESAMPSKIEQDHLLYVDGRSLGLHEVHLLDPVVEPT